MSPDQLLLDADIIAFKIASVSQKTFQFSPEDEHSVVADDWEDVVPRIHYAIAALMETLGTTDVIVCLSCPTAENFRLGILPTYKGNRDYSKRPVHLGAIKDYMEAHWPSYRRPTLEADDIMGILSTREDTSGIRKIIVSEDKDMQTIPGWLYNPAKDSKPRWISPESADRFHLYQTLVGDTTDGYAGCPGSGPMDAADLLDNPYVWMSYQHTFKSGPRKGLTETRWDKRPCLDDGYTLWDAVVARFEKAGLTEADALVQARVARILRASDFDFNTKKVILWTPLTASLPA